MSCIFVVILSALRLDLRQSPELSCSLQEPAVTQEECPEACQAGCQVAHQADERQVAAPQWRKWTEVVHM